MPDRSKGRGQTKSDTLVLQVGSWVSGISGSGWGRSSFKDKNEAVGSHPTGYPRANESAPAEVKDKDWLLECEESIPGWQTGEIRDKEASPTTTGMETVYAAGAGKSGLLLGKS